MKLSEGENVLREIGGESVLGYCYGGKVSKGEASRGETVHSHDCPAPKYPFVHNSVCFCVVPRDLYQFGELSGGNCLGDCPGRNVRYLLVY